MEHKEKTHHMKDKAISKILIIIFCAVLLATIGFIIFSVQNNSNFFGGNTSVPEDNALYAAKKGNEQVLFYRYPDLIIEHKKPQRTIGHIASYGKPYNHMKDPNTFADFKELQNPKKLFTFEGHLGIENYLLSNDKNYLLLSYIGGKTDTTNYIYQIDLRSGKSKKIWENELRTGSPPYNKGIAYVTNFIPNRYIAFAIVKSASPEEVLPEGVIIKNIQTGKEEVLDAVGDITIDMEEKVVKFKSLEKTPVPCEENDPVCFATDTYKHVYKPAGDISSHPLP